jgi:hypothetical protein
VDLERSALAAEVMDNWIPRVLGSMSLRPGLEYLASTRSDAVAKCFAFIFSDDDMARLELTSGKMRVFVDDELVNRVAVTAAVTNGAFGANVTSWTDSDEAGATSQWQTGGYMALLGDGTNAAIRDQQVTVNEVGTQHALRIVVARGPVILRIGSTSGGDEYVAETTLGTGTHSIAFTPTGNFYVRLMNRRSFTSLVDSVSVESSGTLEIDTPWVEADLQKLRMTQSADVIYVACDGYQQRKIERRDGNSWSIVLYEPETGPFRNVNTSPITIAPSALFGDVNLVASSAFFKSTHVGALFRLQSVGQTVTKSITAQNTFSDPIRVAGVDSQRAFGLFISNTFVANVTLQYSVGEPGSWVDVATYTTGQSISHDDGLDNQIIYYRIGVKTGGFTSGQVDVTLSYSSGSITGVARVTEYTDPTQVSAVVLQDFGATTASSDWWEGAWSDRRGHPSAVTLFEGRLWSGGNDKTNGSIVDQYEDFDDEFEGDAGPISRNIGEGPVQTINWMLALNRLIIGTLANSAPIDAIKLAGNNVLSGRSSSFDEPLTPTNFNLKSASASGIFVDRSRQRLMALNFDLNESDYKPEDLTVAVPEVCEAGILQIAVQYRPDLRIHTRLADGTVVLCTLDRAEGVICFSTISTDGEVEDISVLPGDEEDQVYYIVNRGSSRFHEKWAKESECRGGILNKQADAFYEYSGSAVTTITGLSHLEGESVVVWGAGKDLGTFTVSSGQITGLAEAVTGAIIGLPYEARYKSAKQAFAAAMGTPLNQKKKIDHVGFILDRTHAKGIQFGPGFDNLDDLPDTEDHDDVGDDTIHDQYDHEMHPFDGEWTTDARVCLKAAAPRPATVLAFTVSMTTNG